MKGNVPNLHHESPSPLGEGKEWGSKRRDSFILFIGKTDGLPKESNLVKYLQATYL